jgi:hypothetical protein
MRKVWELEDMRSNRYFVSEYTSGSTNDIYLTNGTDTIMLEDCLIWEDDEFTDAEADDILAHLQTTADGVGVEEYEGWYLCTVEVD